MMVHLARNGFGPFGMFLMICIFSIIFKLIRTHQEANSAELNFKGRSLGKAEDGAKPFLLLPASSKNLRRFILFLQVF